MITRGKNGVNEKQAKNALKGDAKITSAVSCDSSVILSVLYFTGKEKQRPTDLGYETKQEIIKSSSY